MKSKKNLARFTYEKTCFQGWCLRIDRSGQPYVRYFPDREHGGPSEALRAAEAKLAELQGFLDTAPRKDGKLTKTAEAGARKVLEAGQQCGTKEDRVLVFGAELP